MISLLWIVVIVLWSSITQAETPPNYNSSDAGCNPSDPTVLFCEGFETPNPGSPPLCNLRLGPYADDLGANTFDNCAKGWGVHIPDPGGGWTRSGKSPFGSHSAFLTGGIGSTGYDHGFVGGVAVTELYVRWYQTFPVGWSIGQYKLMSPNDHGPNGAGLVWGNLHLGCGAGTSASSREMQWQAPVPEDTCYNLGLNITGGHLYFMEMHIRVSQPAQSANGVIEFWGQDCGTNLTSVGSCTGTPPLLFTKTNIRMPSNGTNIKTLWWEGWCSSNPSCNSIDSWMDEILVKTTGPIGYAGAAPPPPPPAAPSSVILFVSNISMTTIAFAFQLLAFAIYVWTHRTTIVRISHKLWKYAATMPSPKEMYWVYKYKKAVKRWQAKSPPMLEQRDYTTVIEIPKNTYKVD